MRRAQITGKLGELALKRGDMESATLAFEESLRLLGRTVPRHTLTVFVMLGWELAVQTLHTLFPKAFAGRKRECPESELLAARLYSRLAYGYWYVRGRFQTLWTHLCGMNLAERYPPTPELAQAYSVHSAIMSLTGLFDRGITYAEKSYTLRKSFGDLWGQGQSRNFHSVVLYHASRFSECVERSRESIRLLQRTGDYWELNIARYQNGAALYRMGDLRGALQVAKCTHESGREVGDEQASGISLDIWARATAGRVPEEILKDELKRTRRDTQGTTQVLLADGVRLMGLQQYQEAAERFSHALVLAKKAGIVNAYVAPNLAWLATALRCQAEQQPSFAPWNRNILLFHAEVAACRALRTARWLQNDLPHALREYAQILAMRGDTRRASRFFEKSLAVAGRQGARYEHAQTLLAYGRMLQEMGRAGADLRVAAAEAALREIVLPDKEVNYGERDAATPTLSLADRFDTVLKIGRRIAASHSRTMVFSEVRNAALRLLRSEHCLVLEATRENGQELFTPVAGTIPSAFNRAMLTRRGSGRQSRFPRRHDARVRARFRLGRALGAVPPIFVRGRTDACLYVAHYQAQCHFGPHEERLADFIATIAGAAWRTRRDLRSYSDSTRRWN